MVEKFQQILEKIIKEKGDVIFFGIFKMDDLTDRWSILFSANWIDDNNRDTFFNYLIDLIKTTLGDEESKTIARIGLFSHGEHLIDLLLDYKTGSRIQDQAVNGNIIHDGYILASNRDIDSRVVPL